MRVMALLVFCLLLAVVPVKSKTVHIRQSRNGTVCLEPESCVTFFEVVASPAQFFTSDTMIVFHPGEYRTSRERNNVSIAITGVSNLTISGSSVLKASRILCNGNNLFSFLIQNSTNITIQKISFVNCTNAAPQELITEIHNLPDSQDFLSYFGATILIQYAMNIQIDSVSISNSSSVGILAINNFGYLRITMSNFTDNRPPIAILQMKSMNNIENRDPMAFTFHIEECTLKYGRVKSTYPFNLKALSLLVDNNNTKTYIRIENSHFSNTQWEAYYNIWLRLSACSDVLTEVAQLHTEGLGLKMDITNCDYAGLGKKPSQELLVDSCCFDMSDASPYLQNSIFQNVKRVRFQNVTFSRSAHQVVLIENSNVVLTDVQFTNNVLYYTRPLVELRKSYLSFDGKVTFLNNRALSSLQVQDSNITFTGLAVFEENEAYGNGGAISMLGLSFIIFHKQTQVLFINNHAQRAGGAIFVENDYTVSHGCFFTFFENQVIYNTTKIAFKGNTADYAGSIIYGGNMKECARFRLPGREQWHIKLRKVFQLEFNKSDTSQIATKPYYVCKCSDDAKTYSCKWSIFNLLRMSIFPGKTFQYLLVIVGRTGDTVPGTLVATIEDGSTRSSGNLPAISQLQNTQSIGKTCTLLNFTLFSNGSNGTLFLSAKGTANNCINKVTNYRRIGREGCNPIRFIKISFKECPVGFILGNGECVCSKTLQTYHGIQCDISTQTIYRPAPYWIYTDNNTNVIVHKHCPLGYCTSRDVPQLDLLQPDQQCINNHSGILCGQCQNNYSLVLGGSQCKKCSDIWLLLLPVFAAAGILLILFLTFLNLTVATGTINGLIFFLNIVQANREIFFSDTSHRLLFLLGVFVAWTNLDLGVTTCFYNGMNAYAKTWMQFLFPAYIWVILITFIILSNRYTRVAKLCRRNVVSVLCTLFLLSYAKLIRTVITALSYTRLDYPTKPKAVWLYDANIGYITKEHIPLFLAALFVLIFFSIPYTMFLLSAQWIQSKSNYKVFAWIHRMKPLIDSYAGPYKTKYRYWTGLLLLFRVILFLVFSTNATGDPRINTLAIIVATAVLLLLALTGGVYKNKVVNILEWSNYLCLLLLSSATLFILSTTPENVSPSQKIVTGMFVGGATIMFITVITYHTFKELQSSIVGKKVASKWQRLTGREKGGSTVQEVGLDDEVTVSTPTTSEIRMEDLEEPLLDKQDERNLVAN